MSWDEFKVKDYYDILQKKNALQMAQQQQMNAAINAGLGCQNACPTDYGRQLDYSKLYIPISTATTLTNIPPPRALSEEEIRRVIREELQSHSVVEAPSDHAHFMIRGPHEDYCLCGHKVKR